MEEKKNSNILFLLLAIFFIITSLIVLIGAYGLYLNKPYNYYKTTINNKYVKFNEKKAKVFKFNPAENKLDSNIKATFEMKKNGKTTKEEVLDLNTKSDFKNKYINADINIAALKTKTNFIFKDQDEILNDQNIYEKPLIFNEDFNIDWKYLQNINEKDFDTITKAIKNEIIKTLNKKSFETESTKIKVDGKNIKAKKITYVDNNLKDTLNKIIKDLSKNDEFITAVSNMTDLSKKDVTNYLKDLKVTEELKPLEVNLYTTGLFSKLAKMEFIYDGYTISYLNYKDTNYEFILEYQKDKLIISANENKDKELDTKITYNNDVLLTGVIKNHDDDNFKMNFTANILEQKINGKINITTKKDTNTTLIKKTEITIYDSNNKDDYYKLTIEASIDKVKKIKQVDTNDAVKIKDLKKADQDKIEKKLEKLTNNLNPIEAIEKSAN